jgi:hypothetical protein
MGFAKSGRKAVKKSGGRASSKRRVSKKTGSSYVSGDVKLLKAKVSRMEAAMRKEAQSIVNVKIDVQVSGISFQTARRAVERVVIDPRVPGIGDLGIDTTHLASTNLDLYQLISNTVTQPVFPDPEQVRVTEREDIEERAAVEAKLDSASTETVLPPNNQPCFYVQLWNSDSLRPRRTPENMRLDVPEFKNLLSEKWPHQPNSDLLAKYFSWLDLNQVSCRLQLIFEEKY